MAVVEEAEHSFYSAYQKRNPHLLDELRKEWEGILAWCVRGCLEWQQDGLKPPPIVIQATSEYRREEDLIPSSHLLTLRIIHWAVLDLNQ